MSEQRQEPADFIVPLNINGLEGRMLRLPARTKTNRELLFIYGSHSSIERWFGLAQELNKLGAVTMPDLPGFGGMTPLYKINKTASIDDLADYMAAFFKLKYKNKKVTVVSMSLGFVIVTRMLQRYPQLTKNVDILISIVGFTHKEDFNFTPGRLRVYHFASHIIARKWPARLFRAVALRPFVLRTVYHRTHNAKEKFADVAGDEFKRTMDIEIDLWHSNDVRTQFQNYLDMFSLDNTQRPIPLPVYHVAAKKDRYFNNVKVEEHMRKIFTDFQMFYTAAPNHAPTVIATAKEAAPFIPAELRKVIRRKRIINKK
jgi:pimeloyl-ACP methyl ester carboxylesterase